MTPNLSLTVTTDYDDTWNTIWSWGRLWICLEAVHKSILPDFKLCTFDFKQRCWTNQHKLETITSGWFMVWRPARRMQRKALEVPQSSLNWLCLRIWFTDWHHLCSLTVDMVEVSGVFRPFTCQVFFENFQWRLPQMVLCNKPFCERKSSSGACYSVASCGHRAVN